MDYQNCPDLKISEQVRQKNQAAIHKLVEESDRSVGKRMQTLRKAGYSDDEIERIMAL